MSEESLPLRQWPAGIQQASVPANENALRVQALLSRALSVENDAPGTEYDGAVYIVGSAPTGAFASFSEHDIALFEFGSWYAWAPPLDTSMVINDVRKVFDGTEWVDDPSIGSGIVSIVPGSGISVDDTDPQNPVVSASGAGFDNLSLITEATAFTATPATHDGRSRLTLAGGDVTFNSAEAYASGQVYNIYATGTIEIVVSGVTLTDVSGGTKDMDAGMAVSIVMTGATTGVIIGYTVAAS